jgi:parallel beta-helix repeat protein
MINGDCLKKVPLSLLIISAISIFSISRQVRADVLESFTLNAGQCQNLSTNKLCMQTDGNLVLLSYANTELWATSNYVHDSVPAFAKPTANMSCASCYAYFQPDGNLVLYNPNATYGANGHSYWASMSNEHAGAELLVSSNNVSVIDPVSGARIWNAGTLSAETTPAIWSPSVLGVSWRGDFNGIAANQINVMTDSRLNPKATGNGTTDDTAAVRAAVALAGSFSGGGTVYFPAGTYKLTLPSGTKGSPLVIPSKVILRGANASLSKLSINNGNTTYVETSSTAGWGGISFSGASYSGMTDLTVDAVVGSSPYAVIWNAQSILPATTEIFFNNVNVNLHNSKSFWMGGITNFLILNSHITAVDDNPLEAFDPILMEHNTNVSILNNSFNYNFGRIEFAFSDNLVFQGNTLTRNAKNVDMDLGTAVESGGADFSFNQNVQVLDNKLETLNAPPGEGGDGESILSQQGATDDLMDLGSVTSATATTITDTAALWGATSLTKLTQYPEVIAIVSGPLEGEFRTIQSINTTTKTVTVSSPWSATPAAGTQYSIFAWPIMNATIQGNTLINNPIGIEMADGCYACTIENNLLTDSRGIQITVSDRTLGAPSEPEERKRHSIATNIKILNNTVTDTLGLRPAFVALKTAVVAPVDSGMSFMDVQISGNVINPYKADPGMQFDGEISQEAFLPCFMFGAATTRPPLTTAFVDITLSDNTMSLTVPYTAGFLPYTTQSCTTP